MKPKIRFIINPNSGTSSKEEYSSWIEDGIDKEKFEADIAITKGPKHATELAIEASRMNYHSVVAVGGDGSVNETAAGLVGTSTPLAIIPCGSGNGMARHLNIPLDFKEALQLVNSGKQDTIDTIRINDQFCIGTIGIGFDAHIAHLFAKSKKRGYSSYVKLVLSEFYKYKSPDFHIRIDGIQFHKKCFLLTFANSSQFGNNAVIAPFADVQDGIMDVSIVKKFPLWHAPALIYMLMKNSLHLSNHFEMLQGREIQVENSGTLQGHIDGEPVEFTSNLLIRIYPRSLNVLVPA